MKCVNDNTTATRWSGLTHKVMSIYKALAADFIKRNSITDRDAQVGVVLYAYLQNVEFKTMATYHSEATRYCYQLTDGTIGTLPICSVDRITDEVLGLN